MYALYWMDDYFVDTEARVKKNARKRMRQKSKNRKRRCVIVKFKLTNLGDDENSDATNIKMAFESYKKKNEIASFSKKYVKKSEEQLPEQPRFQKSQKSPFRSAFDIFQLFYPNYTPEDNPEEFTKLALLINSFWKDVEAIVKTQFKNAVVEEYNSVSTLTYQDAKDLIEQLVNEIDILEGLQETNDYEFVATVCWQFRKKTRVKF